MAHEAPVSVPKTSVGRKDGSKILRLFAQLSNASLKRLLRLVVRIKRVDSILQLRNATRAYLCRKLTLLDHLVVLFI